MNRFLRSAMHLLPLFFILLLIVVPAAAQSELAPPQVDGEAVYVPFPVEITLDGKLDDWANVPSNTVTRGLMTSPDPTNNGSFTFAVAADAENFYITMTSVDANIITGQHGTEFWNEDSLEFYLNLTNERFRTSYTDGIMQININPGDIGNADPTMITVTGTRSSGANVRAFVFETVNGWGFEAVVPISEYITPEHGLEIGFQAQSNGATEKDRNVKLVWSLADTNDHSWSDPSLFGSAVFFEVGSTNIPAYSERAEPVAVEPQPTVSVNQVGYFPQSPKYAMVAGGGEFRTVWSLVNAETNETVSGGLTTVGRFDSASGDTVQMVDFSDVTTPGMYVLVVDNIRSAPFRIGSDLYTNLKTDALTYFYLNRSGIELEEQYAGDWARQAGHITDAEVPCFSGRDADGVEWEGCDYTLNVRGGWYDAGDYGKYVVNGGISAWTLLNLYEAMPDAYSDGSLSIPENANNVPDILDEARWEVEFLLNMQVPQGEPLAGMVHHKMHDRRWSGLPLLPPTEVDNADTRNGRFLFPPSTAATLNVSAVAAQCARIWRTIDSTFSARCLEAAERAWVAANANPELYAGNTPGEGGGNYGDTDVSDEFFWAAAELYITTGDAQYREFLTGARYFKQFPGNDSNLVSAMNWNETAALGTLSLVLVPNELPENMLADLRQQIAEAADRYLSVMNREGYRVSLTEDRYYWGSNSDVLNNAIVLAYAYNLTNDVRYLNGVIESMDYILGRNAMSFSYVSGYGTTFLQHPHHRFWANQPENGFPPPPPGAVAGGPMGNPPDPVAMEKLTDTPPAKSYIDDIGSYSTNEITINWNSPLAWVVTFIDTKVNTN
jgi:endoglucanase